MLGDSFQQINCWLPLGRSKGTNTLQCGSLERSIERLTRFGHSIEFDVVRYANERDFFVGTLCRDPGLVGNVKARRLRGHHWDTRSAFEL